ncbi:hypothetical protein SAMN02910400_00247 [Lachnospiraceae bacterium C10]|nr:hypothetical protein SAMN02910400_00247 [Lachnospiraceae bacterium C10]
MLNKPYKTLLATLVLATGLSVVPASTVQAEMVHITLEDGTEADIERSEIKSFIEQHYGGKVVDSHNDSDTEYVDEYSGPDPEHVVDSAEDDIDWDSDKYGT